MKGNQDEKREIEVIERALGLAHGEGGAADAVPATPRDVPPAEPGDAAARELAVALAPLAYAARRVRPSAALRERVLAAATEEGRYAGVLDRLRALTDLPDARLAELIQAARDPRGPGWADGPATGVRWFRFSAGAARGNAPAALVHCEPGAAFPVHEHRGAEWALVLDGAAVDSSGASWGVGDWIEHAGGTRHSFRAGESAPLLAAVVAEDGVVLSGPSDPRS